MKQQGVFRSSKEVHQWLISPQWPSMWNETHAHTQTHIHTQIIQRIPSHTMMTPWTGATLSLRAWLPFNSVKMDITVPLHAWYHVFLEAGCTNRPPVFHINHIISLFKYHNVFLYVGQLTLLLFRKTGTLLPLISSQIPRILFCFFLLFAFYNHTHSSSKQ